MDVDVDEDDVELENEDVMIGLADAEEGIKSCSLGNVGDDDGNVSSSGGDKNAEGDGSEVRVGVDGTGGINSFGLAQVEVVGGLLVLLLLFVVDDDLPRLLLFRLILVEALSDFLFFLGRYPTDLDRRKSDTSTTTGRAMA